MAEAADVLRALLRSESEAVRLAAARSMLQLGSELRAASEVEERLRALEEALEREREAGRGGTD
jgi:hypothetical protein